MHYVTLRCVRVPVLPCKYNNAFPLCCWHTCSCQQYKTSFPLHCCRARKYFVQLSIIYVKVLKASRKAISTKSVISRQTIVKVPDIKLHENYSSGNRAGVCWKTGRRTERQDEANRRFSLFIQTCLVSRSFLYDALKGSVIALTVRVRGYSPLLFTDRYFSLLVKPYPLSQLSPLGLSFGDWFGVWRFVLGRGQCPRRTVRRL